MPSDAPGPLEVSSLSIALLAFFALVGALLSALGAALEELPDERLMAIRDGGGKDGATAARLLEDRDAVRARLLSGRVLAIAAVAAFTAQLVMGLLSEVGVFLAVGASALLYAILAEVAQTLARRGANRIALPLLRACRPLELLFAPLGLPVLLVARGTARFAREPSPLSSEIAGREVEHLLERHEEEGTLPEEQTELLMNVLEFKDTMVREVMVPRTRMIALDIRLPFASIVEHVVAEGHSRFPVYRERLDKVEGILHAKDLFHAERQGLTSVLPLVRRNALFVPETQKVSVLLREMQARHQHLAVVIDEFGGTAGIVTLEDILEEIVGEIQDEHDTEESLVTEIAPGRFLLDAGLSIYDVDDVLGLELAECHERADSLGGLVVERFGRVPSVGETLVFAGVEITVKEADEKRVLRLELTRSSAPPSVKPAPPVREPATVREPGSARESGKSGEHHRVASEAPADPAEASPR